MHSGYCCTERKRVNWLKMSTIHVFRSNSSSILNTRTLKLLLKVYTIIVYSSLRCERKLRPKKKYCYDAPFFYVHVVVTRSWEVHVLGYYKCHQWSRCMRPKQFWRGPCFKSFDNVLNCRWYTFMYCIAIVGMN